MSETVNLQLTDDEIRILHRMCFSRIIEVCKDFSDTAAKGCSLTTMYYYTDKLLECIEVADKIGNAKYD